MTLECSKGTRADREEIIREMVNLLDGLDWEITPPDRPEHYLIGRLHVAVKYNNLAHAAVTVTGVCRPWLYSKRETKFFMDTAQSTTPWITVRNSGRLAVVPTVTVAGDGAVVSLMLGDHHLDDEEAPQIDGLTPGTYKLPDFLLRPGAHELYVYAFPDGEVTISFREAVLR